VAAEPMLRRRYAAGAESARGLLFTVLGEFVLPTGGVAWTSTFIEVLARLGVEEKATRQALMRTASDGWLTSERIGRRARWRLTVNAERLLTEGSQRIYGFTGPAPKWDGQWLLVLARAPETDRAARHLLRTRLSWAGFGTASTGVWISTHTERIADAERALKDAGVYDDAHIFVAEHSRGDLDLMLRQAWDLAAIEQRYQDFISAFAGADPSDVLVRLIDLVHSWRRFPWIDPTLPRDLLPAQWSGATAVKLFHQRHTHWAKNAMTEWAQLNDR
jgi:phenylacetic acid degradation operon negative regulatory protein